LIPAIQGRWIWPGVFAACVVVAGLRSILLGKDANWDLRNYHYYNVWALLNGRLGFDVAPAMLQTYHNPLADLPFYWLVHVLQDPRAIAFWMGAYAAVAAYFLLRILVLLFPFDRSRANGAIWVGCAALIGLTGAAGTATWGSTMNEWPSAALALAALWLVVRAALEGGSRRPYACAMAGFVMGCAVGLKLTYGIFALGLLAACASHGSLRERLARPVSSGLFMALGFLATYGWWGWILWREFENPFFIYFNSVFQSPWWEPVAFVDRNFGPRDWKQWIFFPVYFSRRSLLVSEVGFRDYRLAVLLALAIAAWAMSRARNLRENPNAPAPPPDPLAAPWRAVALFTLVSYVAWLQLFGIYRYLVPLEATSGALIVASVLYVWRGGRWRLAVVAILTVLLVGTTRPGTWGRIEFGDSYFDVKAPEIAPDALVIMGYRHPMAYAAPFFRPGTRFVSPANNFLDVQQRNLLARRAAELIRGHRGPLYLLAYKELDPFDERTLAHFNLVLDEPGCKMVRSSMDIDYMRICPLRRR
jgi:hypothetical protein